MSKPLPTLRPSPAGRAPFLSTAVLVGLLALMAARTTLSEPPFRIDPFKTAGGTGTASAARQVYEPDELLRVASAVAILTLAAVWAAGLAWRSMGAHGRTEVLRHPVFGMWVVLLAVCLLATATKAGDRREAFNAALEQISLLTAAFLTMQVARLPWQRRLALVVLAGVGIMLGAKGVYQVFVEVPDQIADLARGTPQRLAELGIDPDSVRGRMLQGRAGEPVATGWFGHANVFGSLVVLTALSAIALAADKWLWWHRHRRESLPRQDAARPHAMEVPLPALAAAVSILAAALPVATWWLTDSTGVRAAGIVAGALAIGLLLVRGWAARHRQGLLLAAGGLLLAGILTVAAVGILLHGSDRLPSASLRVRWYYWSTGAQIIRHNAMLGVGPGNFGDQYLLYRPPQAEEDVKNPHNVLIQALAEYGVAGGLVYLSLVAGALVLLTYPQDDEGLPAPRAPAGRWAALAIAAVFVLAGAWRLGAITYPDAASATWEHLVPLLGLAVGLAVSLWAGQPRGTFVQPVSGAARLLAAGGLAGFALHNLTDFALFQPGAAMAFWVAAGALAGDMPGRSWRPGPRASLAVASVVLAGLLAAAVFVLQPVWGKTHLVRQAALAATATPRREQEALRWMGQAVRADPLDAETAMDLADLHLSLALGSDSPEPALTQAAAAVRMAMQRNPRRAWYWTRAIQVKAYQLDPGLFQAAWPTTSPWSQDQRTEVAAQLARQPDPWLLNRAAQDAVLTNNPQMAELYLREAIDLRGEQWPLLWDHLGDVLAAQGRWDEARQAWDKFFQTRQAKREEWKQLQEPILGATRMDVGNIQQAVSMAELAWQVGLTPLAEWELNLVDSLNPMLNVFRLTDRQQGDLDPLRRKVALFGATSQPTSESAPSP